jgi:hypothetical protein
VFELGEDLFDWVQVGTVGGQVDEFCADGFQRLPDGLRLVATEVDRLRKEVARLKAERDILKKGELANAYFAKEVT